MTEAPASRSKTNALTGREFAGLMKRYLPFESSPHLAVALSGGADSMALALLLRDWVAKRGGSLLALHVDHGLRPESGKEAAWLVRNLKAEEITVRVLRWKGEKPESAIQEGARRMRYDLLEKSCRRAGILHLAAAHHLEDQAETFLMRLSRGSGSDGLAAMAPERNSRNLRLIRPLLTVPKARLIAFLAKRRQPWIEDPSNRDERFSRVRIRRLLPALTREGLSPGRLGAAAADLAALRSGLEEMAAAYLARHAALCREGYVLLERDAFAQLPADIQGRVLLRCLLCLGGKDYGPRLDSLEKARSRVFSPDFRGLTLAGCRILPHRDQLLVCREAGRIAAQMRPEAGHFYWDERFEFRIPRKWAERRALAPLKIVPAERAGTGWIPENSAASTSYKALPAAVRASLPVLSGPKGVIWAPFLGFVDKEIGGQKAWNCRFAPKFPLCPPTFTVV